MDLKYQMNHLPKSEDKNLPIMSVEEVQKAREFHKSFPQYTVTPLADLKAQAANLGIGKLCVKDESYRFGLNAFKVLGGSYAMARYIAQETGKDVSGWERKLTVKNGTTVEVEQFWNCSVSVKGNVITVTPADYNKNIVAGGSVGDIGIILNVTE